MSSAKVETVETYAESSGSATTATFHGEDCPNLSFLIEETDHGKRAGDNVQCRNAVALGDGLDSAQSLSGHGHHENFFAVTSKRLR